MNKKNRKIKLEEISKENKTVILYEAPHKIENTLTDLLNYLGDVDCVIARELTKIHEEISRGKISEMIEKYKEPKGEFIILLNLNKQKIENNYEELTLEEHYKMYEEKGLEKREIIKQIAKDRNVAKNEIYQYFIKK